MARTHRLLAVVVAFALLAAARSHDVAAQEARVGAQAWADTGTFPLLNPVEGRLYVAATAGAEDARTFVYVDATGLDVVGGRLVLAEDGADSVRPDVARLSACALAGPFSGQGRIEGALPAEDCSLRVAASRSPAGTWVVELAVFAEAWANGRNHGLVVFPDAGDATSAFRVSFDAARTAVEGITSPTTSSTTTTTTAPATGDDGEFAAPVLPPVAFTPSTTTSVPALDVGGQATVRPPARVIEPAGTSRRPVDAASPSAAWIFTALLAVAGGVLLGLRRTRGLVVPPRLAGRRGFNVGMAAVVAAVLLLPLRYSELTVFKAGIVLVFLVAAFGLHVLVNWAGQLSLAHAAMVGLPAFVVLAVSAVHDISPVYLLPLGVAVGAVVGGIVALPTMRARGLQVALVTFAAGIGIERFFFTKPWLIGPVSGRRAATPAVGPVEFTTSKGLYPVLLLVVVLAAVALWALMHSRVGRAWFWIRADADAAAAFGVPVARYKILAFATAGGLGGLSGGLFVMWVQQVAGDAFPSSLSFDYLLTAVLAGQGYLGGVAAAAFVLQGGRLFFTFFGWLDAVLDYIGPVALIYNITRYQAGFNGLGRHVMEKLAHLRPAGREQAPTTEPEPVSLTLVGGALAIVAGFVAIAVAWYHLGNTDETWVQNQELLSGGVGGLALVVTGAALLIRDRLARQHDLLAAQLEVLLATAGTTVDEARAYSRPTGTSEATVVRPSTGRRNRGRTSPG